MKYSNWVRFAALSVSLTLASPSLARAEEGKLHEEFGAAALTGIFAYGATSAASATLAQGTLLAFGFVATAAAGLSAVSGYVLGDSIMNGLDRISDGKARRGVVDAIEASVKVSDRVKKNLKETFSSEKASSAAVHSGSGS